MPYAALHERCPAVAARETRSITIFPETDPRLPPATYQFVEMYCNEPGCDCRRVMFSVISSVSERVEAVVAWGWETLDYYRRWMGADDPSIKEMQGPILNLGSAHGPCADAILELTMDVLLKDPAYVERIKRHYAMFRQYIERGQAAQDQRRPSVASVLSPKMRAAQRRRRSRNRQAGQGS